MPKIPLGELRDYRPISVLPALLKALEVIMCDQMIYFIDGNRLFSPTSLVLLWSQHHHGPSKDYQ
jgi:hypothetical protein